MSDAFAVTATDGAARAGVLHTAHGDVPTPAFMPVGTKATVKTVDPEELRTLGTRILLGNTYHLHFRPGEDAIAALGGLAIGEERPLMFETTAWAAELLPQDRPRYFMGIGDPEGVLEVIERGVDMFDCVLPTRTARTGSALTWEGRLNLRNARHARDPRPLDQDCRCPACRRFSRAYIRHLINQQELLGLRLLSLHNLRFLLDLTAGARAAIQRGEFGDYKRNALARLETPAEEEALRAT